MKVRGKWAILAICLVVTIISKAQGTKQFFQINEESPVVCGSDIIHQRMLIEDANYKRSFESQSEILRQSIDLHQGSGAKSMVVYTVPVVVHVMHNGETVGTGVNISDEQIQSAIDGLNEDYRKMPGTNGDGAGVDVEIEFCLASRDPDGNPTNGINRVDASGLALYADEGISIGQGNGANETALKAMSKWDRDDYYNIWIVSEIEDNDGGAGIQGFAYFPSSSASKDGAVILYNAFGTVGNLKSYTSLNRTTTHELGHAFFLYHTFQGSSCSESNCSTQGDQVCDTPPTISNTGCASPACGGTQQVENYMDYTHETCMDMFTQGQKDRMRNSLTTTRSSLLSSLGCTPPNALDAGIVNITEPAGFSCSSNFSPQVELKNFGSNTITSVQIKYRKNSAAIQTYTYNGSLTSGETVIVTLPGMSAGAGAHTFEAYTEAPNGGTDGYQSNDSYSTDFEVVEGSTITVSIDADNYGNETTWEVTDSGGSIIASGGPYPSGAYGTTFEHEFCLAADCYDFTIYDSYGDGLCCGGGFGGYEVTDEDGNVLAESVSDFDYSETTPFCTTASTGGGQSPNADFSASETLVCIGSTVQFTDASTQSPSSWLWSFPGGSPSTSTSQNPTVLYNTAGAKTVTLTSTNASGSDTETRTAYITVGQSPTLSTSVTDASCFNSIDGSIDLSRTGGTGPFNYSWSNGASSQDINDLGAGNYNVNVTDAVGCTATASATVSAPDEIVLSITNTTDASCASDGSATVSASGGSPGYTYLWNDPDQQTTPSVDNLAAGDYTLIVTDSEGCQASIAVNINGSSDMELAGSKTNITCNGAANGSATVSPTGGQPPYTYQWANGQTSATATGLSGGSIQVTVTDDSGCQANRDFWINEPDLLDVATVNTEEESCSGSQDGSIAAQINGGTTPYSYHWNGAGFGQTLSPQGVSAGVYTLSVTDDNGCATQENFNIEEAEAVQIDMTITDETCNEANDGSILVELSGGNAPYTYNWNGAGFGFTLNPQGVQAGSYIFRVIDNNGCETLVDFEVQEPEALVTSVVQLSADSCGLNVGRAEISVSGGTGQKTIQWDDSDSQTGNVLQNVRFGIYTADIEDENNCTAFHTVEIEDLTCSVTSVDDINEVDFVLYPNPVENGQFTIELGDPASEQISMMLIDITGKEVQNWSFNNTSGLRTFQLNREISEGIYLIQLSDGQNINTQKLIIR